MWFLKNHDFIHVNSSVAGKYSKHKQDGSHLGFPIRMILATVNLQVTSILPMNFESIALSVQNRFSRWLPWPQCRSPGHFSIRIHTFAPSEDSDQLHIHAV